MVLHGENFPFYIFNFQLPSGAVIAVDLDVIVGQVAAPGGGGVGAVAQGDQDLDLLLQEDLLAPLLGEEDAGAVFADGDHALVGAEADADLADVHIRAGVADGAEDSSPVGIGT